MILKQSLEVQKSQLTDTIERQKYKRVMISRSFLARGFTINHIVGYFKMAKIVTSKYSRENNINAMEINGNFIAG